MIYRCRACEQPITREMAIKTLAGHFTDGRCERHILETPVLAGDDEQDYIDNMGGEPEKGVPNAEANPNAQEAL